MLLHGRTVDTLYFASVVAYLAALYWWRGETQTTLLIFGNGDRPLRQPLMRLWNSFFLLALIRVLQSQSSPGTGSTTWRGG